MRIFVNPASEAGSPEAHHCMLLLVRHFLQPVPAHLLVDHYLSGNGAEVRAIFIAGVVLNV